jgi:hypothetical protein
MKNTVIAEALSESTALIMLQRTIPAINGGNVVRCTGKRRKRNERKD